MQTHVEERLNIIQNVNLKFWLKNYIESFTFTCCCTQDCNIGTLKTWSYIFSQNMFSLFSKRTNVKIKNIAFNVPVCSEYATSFPSTFHIPWISLNILVLNVLFKWKKFKNRQDFLSLTNFIILLCNVYWNGLLCLSFLTLFPYSKFSTLSKMMTSKIDLELSESSLLIPASTYLLD